MKFQIQLEITFRVHGGIVAGNELFLFFHIFQQLLAQVAVVIESGDDVLDEEGIHHQTDIKGVVQFMGRQCAYAHAFVWGVDHQFFLCQTLQCLFYRRVADAIFSCQFFDIDFFAGNQLFICDVFFDVRINLVCQCDFFAHIYLLPLCLQCSWNFFNDFISIVRLVVQKFNREFT